MSKQTEETSVPVAADDEPVEESPYKEEQADSNAQLEADDKEAIDKGNIVKERTRGAKPQGPGYSEGPGEDEVEKK